MNRAIVAVTWEQCRDKFNSEMHAKKQCGASGCWGDNNETIFDICGKQPHATGVEKARILKCITDAYTENGNFDAMVKAGDFSSTTASGFDFVSAEDARAACKTGPAAYAAQAKKPASTIDELASELSVVLADLDKRKRNLTRLEKEILAKHGTGKVGESKKDFRISSVVPFAGD